MRTHEADALDHAGQHAQCCIRLGGCLTTRLPCCPACAHSRCQAHGSAQWLQPTLAGLLRQSTQSVSSACMAPYPGQEQHRVPQQPARSAGGARLTWDDSEVHLGLGRGGQQRPG